MNICVTSMSTIARWAWSVSRLARRLKWSSPTCLEMGATLAVSDVQDGSGSAVRVPLKGGIQYVRKWLGPAS